MHRIDPTVISYYPPLVHSRLEEPLAAQLVQLDHTTPSHRTADAIPLLLVPTLLQVDMQIFFLVGVQASSQILDSPIALGFQIVGTLSLINIFLSCTRNEMHR